MKSRSLVAFAGMAVLAFRMVSHAEIKTVADRNEDRTTGN